MPPGKNLWPLENPLHVEGTVGCFIRINPGHPRSKNEFKQEKSGENGEKLLYGLCCLRFKIQNLRVVFQNLDLGALKAHLHRSQGQRPWNESASHNFKTRQDCLADVHRRQECLRHVKRQGRTALNVGQALLPAWDVP